jgi:AraC-like DNA-binding protein
MKDLVEKYLREHPRPVRASSLLFCDLHGVSPSTLRRHLRADSTSWTRLYSAELKRRIDAGLTQGDTPAEISQRIGYQSRESLYRVVKQLCGPGYLRSARS